MPTTELLHTLLAQTTPSVGAPVSPPAGATSAPTSTVATPPLSSDALSDKAGTTATPGGATPAAPASGSGGLGILPMMLMVVAVWVLMFTLTGRKDKKKRAALMSAMGKGDKVLTIGGQIGIVDAVRENEVVLRIDENSSAKARFTKASIQQILESASKGPEPETVSGGTVEIKTKGEKLLSAR